jgi:hypothetical protein
MTWKPSITEEIEETYREINHPSGVPEVYEPKKDTARRKNSARF